MPADSSYKPLLAWLELLRFPNLFTVPGDPLAGLLIAAGTQAWEPMRLVGVCTVSVLVYLGGLALNDVMDLEEDRAERPQRPLPSGRIHPRTAMVAALLLAGGALGLCALIGRPALYIGMVLVLLVSLYNTGLKNIPVFGPITMGLCRGCSLLLGATAMVEPVLDAWPLVVAFEFITIYIALVTLLARYETQNRHPGLAGGLPPLVLLTGLISLVPHMTAPFQFSHGAFMLFSTVAVFLAIDATRCIYKSGRITPGVIGQFISLLIIVQVALVFWTGHSLAAVLLALGWPLNRLLAVKFYAS